MSDTTELLEESLEYLREQLQGDVECLCILRHVDGDIVPEPASIDPDDAPEVERLLDLVRRIEGAVGRPAEHANPQWLDDLIDGKWGLL